MWLTILVVCLFNLLSTALYIISSFGNAILMQLCWQICSTGNKSICSGNIAEAVFYISISTGISAPIQLYTLWNSINWPIAINLTLSQLVGGFIGTSLLFIVQSVWMVRSLGIFFSLLAVQYIVKEAQLLGQSKFEHDNNIISVVVVQNKNDNKNNNNMNMNEDDEELVSTNNEIIAISPTAHSISISSSSSSSIISTTTTTTLNTTTNITSSISYYFNKEIIIKYTIIWSVGLCAGLLGGLFGTPGPPLMLYVTRSSMSKNEVRATLAVSYTFGTYERLIMMSLSSNSPINFVSMNTLYSFIGILFTCLIGRVIGEYLGKYVNENIFRRIIMGILIFGSTTMITSGISLNYQLIAYLIFTIIYCLIGFIVYYMTKSNVKTLSISSISSLSNYNKLSTQNNKYNNSNSNKITKIDQNNHQNLDNEQKQILEFEEQIENKQIEKSNYFHILVNKLYSYEYFHERF